MSLFKSKPKNISANPRQFDEVHEEIFDRITRVAVERNRAFFLNIILAISVLVLVSAIRYMLPLERTVPYTIVENIEGRYKADFSSFKTYKPEEVVVERQARNLAKNLYTMLSYKDALENLDEAKTSFVGKAITQFVEWFQDDQPTIRIKNYPDLTRTVEIKSSSMMPNNVVIVRFRTITSVGEEMPEIRNLILTTKYIVSPRKSRAEALANPTGVFFEHFTIDTDK